MQYQTPILFLLYNRPETAEQVFAEIKKARPARLFVAADGPSAKRENDHEKCSRARSVIDDIDWECEVKTLFRDQNLGCKRAISSAISWFFDQVEEGVVLEDDCLPSQGFFRYCSELLEYYRDNDKVMVVSGDNFLDGRSVTNDSYYFSRYPHCWGWATWRRAWQKYDGELKSWPDFRSSQAFLDIGADNPLFKSYWTRNFERVLSGDVDSWAYAWTLNCWANGGLTAIPVKNLVKNIGYGLEATHTTGSNSRISAMRAHELDFPLKHPTEVLRNVAGDHYADVIHFGLKPAVEKRLSEKVMQKIASLVSKIRG